MLRKLEAVSVMPVVVETLKTKTALRETNII